MKNANNILMRCSCLGYLMTEPQGKSPKQKYTEALEAIGKAKDEYDATLNKNTKTAQKKLEQIRKLNTRILELEPMQSDIHLSDTAIKALLKIYAAENYGRYEEITNKYLEKGNYREEDAITILSRVMKIMFKKNGERLRNKFFQGEPDLFEGESIYKADHTLDTKCCWSLITFLEAQHSELNSNYEWQGHGYMSLTGARKHTVAYCLVNGTYTAINDEMRRAAWKMGVLDVDITENNDFIQKAKQIERNHIFDLDLFMQENPHYSIRNKYWYSETGKYCWDYDIPFSERVHTISFDRDDDKIKAAEERVELCRAWMNKNLYKSTNLITQ